MASLFFIFFVPFYPFGVDVPRVGSYSTPQQPTSGTI